MDPLANLGLGDLWPITLGDPRICVAVLDGPVDQTHRCFEDARLSVIGDTMGEERGPGRMASHGTHVASVIFGRHDSPVRGIAPQCRGVLIPIFSEKRTRLSQFTLSGAIDRAVEEGAHVINISGGQLTYAGESEDLLEGAIESAKKKNVLIVAAAGNDRDPANGIDQCLHVPAALPTVLTVGAIDESRHPLDFSCWGSAYGEQGVLAPGAHILGAVPGGGIARKSGTSMATPIVSGLAALLLSLQLKWGKRPDPHLVRSAILEGADPCNPANTDDCRTYLAGIVNPSRSMSILREKQMSPNENGVVTSCACVEEQDHGQSPEPSAPASPPLSNGDVGTSAEAPVADRAASNRSTAAPARSPASRTVQPAPSSERSVLASSYPGPSQRLLFEIGQIGFDFGTEARRDTFKQQMQPVIGPLLGPDGQLVVPKDDADRQRLLADGYRPIPVNPYSPQQLVAYLQKKPDEVRSLIWTLNLELTPVYVIQSTGPYGRDVDQQLVEMLAGQSLPRDNPGYVERASLPALITDRTVRLFSGQVLPVIEVDGTRGMYAWKTADIMRAAMAAAGAAAGQPPLDDVTKLKIQTTLRAILNKIYYEFRNLGVTAPDRALNFAATNIFQLVDVLGSVLGQKNAENVVKPRMLQTIDVLKSPYCRLDSDCWDVQLKFFDPDNTNVAFDVFRFTLDVSDKLPVTLGDVVSWTSVT